MTASKPINVVVPRLRPPPKSKTRYRPTGMVVVNDRTYVAFSDGSFWTTAARHQKKGGTDWTRQSWGEDACRALYHLGLIDNKQWSKLVAVCARHDRATQARNALWEIEGAANDFGFKVPKSIRARLERVKALGGVA